MDVVTNSVDVLVEQATLDDPGARKVITAELGRLREIEAAALSVINGPSLDRRTSQWMHLRRALNG